MAFEDLLDHRCDIYHIQKTDRPMGYGITAPSFVYPETPDLTDIPCHFNVSDSGSMQQTGDVNEYIAVGKLQLPVETEVYVNDKIVDLRSGLHYRAEIPKNIRNHHIIVNIQRKGKVQGALLWDTTSPSMPKSSNNL